MNDQTLTPKKRETRSRILGTAAKIFAAEGVRNADVQVIADLAHVGKGTIYRHFGNKEKLFLAVARFNLEQMTEYITARVEPSDPVPKLLMDAAVACAEFHQANPGCVEIMIQERAEFRDTVFPTYMMFRAENETGVESLFRRGIEAGQLRPLAPRDAAKAYSDMLFGGLVCGCLEGARHKLVERIRHAVQFFLQGVCLPSPTNAQQ